MWRGFAHPMGKIMLDGFTQSLACSGLVTGVGREYP